MQGGNGQYQNLAWVGMREGKGGIPRRDNSPLGKITIYMRSSLRDGLQVGNLKDRQKFIKSVKSGITNQLH